MIKLGYDCPEEVEKMPESSCGFFCDACQRDVYDFRGKTFSEIQQIRKDDPSIKCGVFDDEVVYEDSRTIVNTLFRIAFAAVFILGFNASMLFGQTRVNYPEDAQRTEVSSEKIIIKGTVTNTKGKAINDAVINYYVGEEILELTVNKDGEFTFELPTNLKGEYFYFDVQAKGWSSHYEGIDQLEMKTYSFKIQLEKYKHSPRKGRTAGIMVPYD